MNTNTRADRAARAWLDVHGVLAATQPDGYLHVSPHGTAELVTGTRIPLLNGVVAITRDPDAGEIAGAATSPRLAGLPWSLRVRGEDADDRIAAVAAAHGLATRSPQPFLLRELTPADAAPVAGARRVTGTESAAYQRALAAGFGAPLDGMAIFAHPHLLDHPSMSAYLIEAGGEPVATAFAALSGDLVGVFNIAVLPPFRRRGFGRAATAAALSDAYAKGARTAFLHSTAEGRPLYDRMGFHLAENWTLFT
ncbi:GNAT family N-acetyltransferase [Actinoplanes sp. NPDC048796]|uniref:GNAT family N-acetyltransferase n=1 Tax=unclassified Actinoplanes TaxID=2626549 RepID=UPI0033FAE49B